MTTSLLALDGLVNFRDLGGLPAQDGVVRPGRLYRSESLSDLTAVGREELARSDIGTVIDLRSTPEARHAPGLPSDSRSPRLVSVPLLDGALPTSLDQMLPLEETYATLVQHHGDDFAQVAAVVAQADAAVLIHCTAGKDRTGLAIALVLLAIGVDPDAVRSDYTQSSENLAGVWVARMRARVRAMGFELPDTPEMTEMLCGTTEEGFDAALSWITDQHGSVAGYLRAHGLSEAQLARLHDRLIQS